MDTALLHIGTYLLIASGFGAAGYFLGRARGPYPPTHQDTPAPTDTPLPTTRPFLHTDNTRETGT